MQRTDAEKIEELAKIMQKIQVRMAKLETDFAALRLDLKSAMILHDEPYAPPAPTDLDEFKKTTVQKPKSEVMKKVEKDNMFGDEIEMTDEQYQELQDLDDEDENQDDETFYDCSSCGGTAVIKRSDKRCPNCQVWIDWSDEQ